VLLVQVCAITALAVLDPSLGREKITTVKNKSLLMHHGRSISFALSRESYDAKEILSKIVKIEPLLSFLGALVCTAASTLFQTVESRLNSMVCCSSWKGERRTATILFGRR
jgi:hypothetical protein